MQYQSDSIIQTHSRSLQWLGIPFAMTHDSARSISENTDWLGELTAPYIGSFVDYYLLLIFGGIPWQVGY